MTKSTYITTTIPYVNAAPHLGFALELVQADALARVSRQFGREVRLQTGTDENAFKNVEAARNAAVPIQEWVDTHAAQFRRLADDLNVDCRRFVRTTEAFHRHGAQALWRNLRAEDLYLHEYRGRYCSGCEDFLTERDLVDGLCPDHRRAPQEVIETNWFFRLSAYQGRIENWLQSGAVKICPEKRRREILSFVRQGLQDFSVSRPVARSGGWGVPVPGDPSQVIYVWIDALPNYLSGLGYGEGSRWAETWNERTRKIHVLGRNVWKFHAVYWPALLLSAGLPLPDELVIHGFLTANGRKISKSTDGAISPDLFIQTYGADAVRYFLLRAVPPFEDGDVSADRIASVYKADLADGLGNLASRLFKLGSLCGLSGISAAPLPASSVLRRACASHRHDRALESIWTRIAALNREIEAAKPWIAVKTDALAARPKVDGWLGELRGIARDLAPFLPSTASRLRAALEAQPLGAIPPLFPRLGLSHH